MGEAVFNRQIPTVRVAVRKWSHAREGVAEAIGKRNQTARGKRRNGGGNARSLIDSEIQRRVRIGRSQTLRPA